MNALREYMHKYYRNHDLVRGLEMKDEKSSQIFNHKFKAIFDEMDEFYRVNPTASSATLKSKTHTLIAKYCEPVIFPGNPFFFEIGLDQSKSWGAWKTTPAYWLESRKSMELRQTHPLFEEITNHFSLLFDREKMNLCEISDPFDIDHNTLGYTKLFEVGINGIIKEATGQMAEFEKGTDKYDFCCAIVESCEALVAIAHKFANKAEGMIASCTDSKQCRYLEMIAESARVIPENPPTTFYQGLAMLIFLREVVSVMENMGMSQLGHVDRLLGKLYERDIKEGLLTEEEARELVSLWMMNTDIKFDVENNPWPETSICIELGGCDHEGCIVYNDVTKIFIEEHWKNGFINPKLNCRYSKESPKEYLKLIGRALLDGHNCFALINDEIVIEGLVKSGVELEDARMYLNGGCQETIIEGCGHTEGAALYVSLLRIFDLFLRKDKYSEFLAPIEGADSFDDFYSKFMGVLRKFFNIMTDQRNYRQSCYKNALCCPLYSATQEGCIQNGTDHIRGGAKYNFSTIALIGLANVVDSLYSIKTMVYERKRLRLNEFIEILQKNWEGEELFRAEILKLPKYGHDKAEVDSLANTFLNDISDIIKCRKNERGGNYLPSNFSYSKNRRFAQLLRATPDGRKNYDYIAQGCSPSQLKPIKDITVPIKSMKNIDFTVCGGGISVLDLILPVSTGIDEDVFTALLRSCTYYRCVTIQPNYVSLDDLIAARAEPEKYKNLVVRICGLSAYFVTLSEDVQDEIISRNFYKK